MKELKQVTLEPIQISIEPKTSLLILKQGDSEVKITRTQVRRLKSLKEGEIEDNAFVSLVPQRNRFQMNADTGVIVASTKNGDKDETVVIKKHRKIDDLQRIFDFVEKHKGRIAWDNDFKGKWR